MSENHFDIHELKLLSALQRDGRKPISELADEIGLSATPCSRRFDNLKARGVIKGFAAQLDRASLGLEVEVFVQVRLNSHADDSPEAFIRMVQNMEQVIGCWSLTGDHDFMLHVVVESVDALNSFIAERLLRLKGVRDVRTNLVLKNHKEAGKLPLSQLAVGK